MSRRPEALEVLYVTGNVCNNPLMSQRQVDADVRRLVALDGDVTCAVEIRPSRYKRAFRERFTAAGRQIYNLDSEAPIATALPVRRSVVRHLYAGVAKITPGRVNSTVRLEGAPVLVLGKHPVSGANRRGPRAAATFGMAVRRRLFALDTALTARRVRMAQAHGVNVVILGDLNDMRAPDYSPDQVVAARRGLMFVIAIPAPGFKVALGREVFVPRSQLHTDHAFTGRAVTFLEAARA